MEIVFVHFGPKPPKHLVSNIRRTCQLFPTHQIILLTDQLQNIRIESENFGVRKIQVQDEYSEIYSGLSHPKDFRGNFWFASLARLTAICDYLIENNQPILHIESDVLISGDFPTEKFLELDRPIAYTIIGEKSGVASVFWINSSSAALKLKQFISTSVKKDPNTTDMKILGLFQFTCGNLVRTLASFPLMEKSAYSGLSTSLTEDFQYTFDLFGGYFDAADIGQYLLGDDPRNHRGVKYLRRELSTSYLRPRSLSYSYSTSRIFLNIETGSSSKLFSLHVHSKMLNVFKPETGPKILRDSVDSQGKAERHVLIPQVFLSSLGNAVRRRFKLIPKVLRHD